MRCVDVIRELAAPTGGPEAAGLAEHLARCPRCAAWAERDAQLDRLWEATQPAEPMLAEWNAVWARVSQTLDQTAASATRPLPVPSPSASTRPWSLAALVLLGLAQAAALLFVIFSQGCPKWPQKPQVVRTVPLSQESLMNVEVEIDPGQLAVIIRESEGVRVTSLALNENAGGIDPTFDGLNSLEAIAQQ